MLRLLLTFAKCSKSISPPSRAAHRSSIHNSEPHGTHMYIQPEIIYSWADNVRKTCAHFVPDARARLPPMPPPRASHTARQLPCHKHTHNVASAPLRSAQYRHIDRHRRTSYVSRCGERGACARAVFARRVAVVRTPPRTKPLCWDATRSTAFECVPRVTRETWWFNATAAAQSCSFASLAKFRTCSFHTWTWPQVVSVCVFIDIVAHHKHLLLLDSHDDDDGQCFECYCPLLARNTRTYTHELSDSRFLKRHLCHPSIFRTTIVCQVAFGIVGAISSA